MPSWFCYEHVNKHKQNEAYFEEFTRPKKCYFMKYHHPVLNDSIPLKNSNNFYMVVFDYPLYFPKIDMIMLIIFGYIPFLISFNCIFQFSSNHIYYCLLEIDFSGLFNKKS